MAHKYIYYPEYGMSCEYCGLAPTTIPVSCSLAPQVQGTYYYLLFFIRMCKIFIYFLSCYYEFLWCLFILCTLAQQAQGNNNN